MAKKPVFTLILILTCVVFLGAECPEPIAKAWRTPEKRSPEVVVTSVSPCDADARKMCVALSIVSEQENRTHYIKLVEDAQ